MVLILSIQITYLWKSKHDILYPKIAFHLREGIVEQTGFYLRKFRVTATFAAKVLLHEDDIRHELDLSVPDPSPLTKPQWMNQLFDGLFSQLRSTEQVKRGSLNENSVQNALRQMDFVKDVWKKRAHKIPYDKWICQGSLWYWSFVKDRPKRAYMFTRRDCIILHFNIGETFRLDTAKVVINVCRIITKTRLFDKSINYVASDEIITPCVNDWSSTQIRTIFTNENFSRSFISVLSFTWTFFLRLRLRNLHYICCTHLCRW